MRCLLPSIRASQSQVACGLTLCALLSLALPVASAAALSHKVCPDIEARPGRAQAGVCYAGAPCVVGLRGDGLAEVVAASAVSADRAVVMGGTVLAAGAGGSTPVSQCVPEAAGAYVSIRLPALEQAGSYTLVLQRSGLFGVARSDAPFIFQVIASHGFLNPRQAQASEWARVGEARTFTLQGRSLGGLRVRADATAVAVVDTVSGTDVQWMSPDQSQIRIRLTFSRAGAVSLQDVFEFIGSGESPVNRDLGWPVVQVMR